MAIDYKEIARPEKLTKRLSETVPTQNEIRSHSSILTNKRLDILFSWADYYSIMAFDMPGLKTIKSFFSVMETILDNVFMVLDEDGLKEAINMRDIFYREYTKLIELEEERLNAADIFRLFFLVKRMNQVIRGNLQKKQYFMKVGKVDTKSMDHAIESIQLGSGIFGQPEKPRKNG